VSSGSRIRILWLIKGLGPGGAERLLVEHAAVGNHHTFEYEVAYLLDWKNQLSPELTALGVPTRSLGVRSERDPHWLIRLHHLVRHGHFDVIHAHSPLIAAAARLTVRTMPRSQRPKLVYTEHNRWPSFRWATRAANALTYPLDDVHFAVSDEVRATIAARFRPRVDVVVHGIDLERVRAQAHQRESVRADLGVDDGEVLALTVANLRATKNYPVLLAAAQLVLESQSGVQFVAAGQGPLEADIRAQLAETDLGNHFRLLGYRNDTTRLIAGADIFVLASRHEGLPVTVMEALTLGIPVVAPAVGGLPEVVVPNETGVLVEPNSARALADGIISVIDPHVRAKLAAGAAATGDRFSSTRAVTQIEAIYRALADDSRDFTQRDAR
jgi:glycosyltransferase involved in cell wall biosynthesis